MRNPLSNSSAKTRIERGLSKCRGALLRFRSNTGAGKSRQASVVGLLLSMSLAGCISLVELARRSAAKNEGREAFVTAPGTAASLNPPSAQPEKEPGKRVAPETRERVIERKKNSKPMPSAGT